MNNEHYSKRLARMAAFALPFLGLMGLESIAQQEPDLDYEPTIEEPVYALNQGPRIGIDEAHVNFHKANGRYKPFTKLLERDGYRVSRFRKAFAEKRLSAIDILVIANPLHQRNDRNWKLPTPSAFTDAEIEAVDAWVHAGGRLLLIADHMPFPGGAAKLAETFGFRFSNGFARYPGERRGLPDRFEAGVGLIESALTQGRSETERVHSVATFTESAFLAPKAAQPILRFGPGAFSLEPQVAWKFDNQTPKTDIAGWLQGAYLIWG